MATSSCRAACRSPLAFSSPEEDGGDGANDAGRAGARKASQLAQCRLRLQPPPRAPEYLWGCPYKPHLSGGLLWVRRNVGRRHDVSAESNHVLVGILLRGGAGNRGDHPLVQ